MHFMSFFTRTRGPTQTTPGRLPDVLQASPRRLPDVSQTSPRRLPDVSQTSPRRLPEVSQTSPRRLPDVSQTFPRRFPNVSNLEAWGEQSVWFVANRTGLPPRLLRPPQIQIYYFFRFSGLLPETFVFPLFSKEFSGARILSDMCREFK